MLRTIIIHVTLLCGTVEPGLYNYVFCSILDIIVMIFQVGCSEEKKNDVCTSNHCCIHLKWFSFSSVWLFTCANKDNSHFLSTNLKYTVMLISGWLSL